MTRQRTANPVVLFDLDDTIMAHREAVESRHPASHAAARHTRATSPAAQRRWHELEEQHYHVYLAGRLSFEGQRRGARRAFAEAFGEALGDAEASAWFAEYFEDYRRMALHGDALPMLERSPRRCPGVRLGIITNGELDFQRSEARAVALRALRARHASGRGRHEARRRASSRRRSSDSTTLRRSGPRTSATGSHRRDRRRAAGLLGVWLNRRRRRAAAGDAARHAWRREIARSARSTELSAAADAALVPSATGRAAEATPRPTPHSTEGTGRMHPHAPGPPVPPVHADGATRTSSSTQSRVFVTAFFQLRSRRRARPRPSTGVQRLSSCQLARSSSRLDQKPTARPAA